jgi:hypothetical protein
MTAPFDIFQAESNGSVRWLGSAESIADAKARVQQHSATSPGEYLLLNQKTGSKLVIKLDDIDTEARR